jgi:hypothetical protein
MRKPSILRIGVWALIVAIGAAFVWFVLPMFFFAAIIFLGRNETQPHLRSRLSQMVLTYLSYPRARIPPPVNLCSRE